MELEEMSTPNILAGFVQEIDPERLFANIMVDGGKEMGTYEDTLEEWESLGEIDIERASYLLSTDEMLEEMLSKT